MTTKRITLKAVKAELATLNISIHKIAGEYKVYPKGTIGQAYFTDDLADARGTGILMAQRLSRPLFVQSSVDGHLFACKYEGNQPTTGYVTLTNEHGCATRLEIARAVAILGVTFLAVR